MELKIEQTLSEFVQSHSAAAALFEKYDLDYCCHGQQTLQQACQGDLIKYRKVEYSLRQIFERALSGKNLVHFEDMEPVDLINHIVDKHHHYLKETMPVIYAHLHKVSAKHGERHPELQEIFNLFRELKTEMDEHMNKEEQIIFPQIRRLNEAFKSGKRSYESVHFNVSASIHAMETEHEKADCILDLIRELSDHFSPPEEACTTYRLAFNELKEFEYDLHQHVHLENNILFPAAVKLHKNLITILSN